MSTAASFPLPLRQFLCPLRRLDYGLNQRDSQLAFLKFHDAINGVAGMSRDCIL